MLATTDTQQRVKASIVRALQLDLAPSDIEDGTLLFAPKESGGLGLDSLAALEVLIVICEEFGLVATEVDPKVFATPATLADYVSIQLGSPAAATAPTSTHVV